MAKSFRQVAVHSIKEPEIVWNEQTFPRQNGINLAAYLAEKCAENGEETAYISCDFGLKSRREPANYEKMLNLLKNLTANTCLTFVGKKAYLSPFKPQDAKDRECTLPA